MCRIHSIQMPSLWRVIFNDSLWNQHSFETFFEPEVRFPQSKGCCRMVKCPKQGDIVFFVLKGTIVMKGIVESDGFVSGHDHQHHFCNVGDDRKHAVPNEFVWINILEVGLSKRIRKTGQRTWVQVNPQDVL